MEQNMEHEMDSEGIQCRGVVGIGTPVCCRGQVVLTWPT